MNSTKDNEIGTGHPVVRQASQPARAENNRGSPCADSDLPTTPTSHAFALTRCARRTAGLPKQNGITAAMLVGRYTDQNLQRLAYKILPITPEKPKGWVEWTRKTPTYGAAVLQSERAARALHKALRLELDGAKCELEISYRDVSGQPWFGRADWVAEGVMPIEVKVSDRYDPGWLLQLSHYIVALSSAKGILAMARESDKASTFVDTIEVSATRANSIVEMSQEAIREVRPSATDCKNCQETECQFNPLFGV